MSLPNIIRGSEEAIFKVRTSAQGPGYTPIGGKMVIEDGRTYRWTENGGTVFVNSRVYQAEVPTAADLANQAVATLTATDNVTVLTGVDSTNTSYVADELKDGYVWFDSAANLNPMWQIQTNTAITAGGNSGTITIRTKIVDDVESGEQITFCKNPWKDVILTIAPPTAMPIGVSCALIAVDGYGWIATGGAVRCLSDTTPLEGDLVCTSVNTAGALMKAVAMETDGPAMGYTLLDQPSAECSLVFLNFDNVT